MGIRIGLFFFGAGVWLAGVVADNRILTGAAIGFVLAAVILGLVARRGSEDADDAP